VFFYRRKLDKFFAQYRSMRITGHNPTLGYYDYVASITKNLTTIDYD